MQDKPTTVAAYAAGASLAAVALFYVFGPNYTIDGDEFTNSNRRRRIVGLSNDANDCFVNSVLQALAGLGDLRLYLIRELHRRELDGSDIYDALPDISEAKRGEKPGQVRELQQGTITRALKDMLDRLNERPIYKKSISARAFIQALEFAFRTRISRSQQDAQEFLQIVAERLSEEYHAAVKARQRAQGLVAAVTGTGTMETASEAQTSEGIQQNQGDLEVRIDDGTANGLPALIGTNHVTMDSEFGFPFEGKLESQIECQFCHYRYKPNQTLFVNLTLQVPQKSSTSLSSCFDGLLKTEYIDDFRCDKCTLQHALEVKIKEKTKCQSAKELELLEAEIQTIQVAVEADPEMAIDSVRLPPAESAPRRRIARHMRITAFPRIIAIHLSRSIYDRSSSTKNAAKVSFPERLALGGILDQKWFKLLAIVCHKGSHNSGHYETFRRNHVYPPFSTPDAFRSYAQSHNPSRSGSPPRPSSASASPSSLSGASTSTKGSPIRPPQMNLPPTSSLQTTAASSRLSLQSSRSKSSTAKSPLSPITNASDAGTQNGYPPVNRASLEASTSRLNRRGKSNNRWWRVSDEKIKECKTSDVLGMQKEVYLMFYEMEKPSFKR